MKRLILFLFVSLFGIQLLTAQQIKITYKTSEDGKGKWITQVYLQASSEEAIDVSAVNFSITYRKDCATITSMTTPLDTLWSTMLARKVTQSDLALTYHDSVYDTRFLFGTAQPPVPPYKPIQAPSTSEAPFHVLTIITEGTCAADIYLEDESEFSPNQLGDPTYTPLPYSMEREGS